MAPGLGRAYLDGVMELFHEDILFEKWTGGKAEGKENLRRAWSDWFARHGGFRFTERRPSSRIHRRCSTAGS